MTEARPPRCPSCGGDRFSMVVTFGSRLRRDINGTECSVTIETTTRPEIVEHGWECIICCYRADKHSYLDEDLDEFFEDAGVLQDPPVTWLSDDRRPVV